MMLQKLRDIKHSLSLIKKSKENYTHAISIRNDSNFSSIYSKLDQTFEIPDLKVVNGIWGIAMVKNEEDIIEESVTHLFKQGIDHVLIVDNGSSDGTYEALERLKVNYSISLGRDLEPAYYQSAKMTWLSDLAQNYGAQWVLPFDADEFWFSREGGTVKDTLKGSKNNVLEAEIFNTFPQIDKDSWVIDDKPHFDVKVCFRAEKNAVIGMGNHTVYCSSLPVTQKLTIIHRPWRSYEQFQRKIKQGAQSLALTDLPEELGYHWRKLGEASDIELYEIWNALVSGKPVSDVIAWKPIGKLHPLSTVLPQKWSDLDLHNN